MIDQRLGRALLLAVACTGEPPSGPQTVEVPDTDSLDPPAEDTGTPSPPESCPVSVEIGGGDVEWVALAEMAEVEMVHGPQGGWHILWSVIVSGTEPTAQLRGIITDLASASVVSDMTYNVELDPLDECTATSLGQYGYLDVSPLATGSLDTPPELLVGHTLSLRVDATDFTGTGATDEIQVVAVPDPDDVD